MAVKGWIGVDLDGVLAKYDGWKGDDKIGEPVPEMVDRVKRWLAEGKDVRIFTARVADKGPAFSAPSKAVKARRLIQAWCRKHIGQELPVTNVKDAQMLELWDDRAVQVEKNKGRPVAR